MLFAFGVFTTDSELKDQDDLIENVALGTPSSFGAGRSRRRSHSPPPRRAAPIRTSRVSLRAFPALVSGIVFRLKELLFSCLSLMRFLREATRLFDLVQLKMNPPRIRRVARPIHGAARTAGKTPRSVFQRSMSHGELISNWSDALITSKPIDTIMVSRLAAGL